MSPIHFAIIAVLYMIAIITISYFTGKNGTNESFFVANRNAKWYLVSFGMIGSSLSGVTFISVPGWVRDTSFTYLQMVFGYFFGYVIIAFVLLPMYYKLHVTSIYTYLLLRFGRNSYKSGALFFLISKTIGASFRLYLMALVLHIAVFQSLGIPFSLTVFFTIAIIWLYTVRGGMKTIIITDVIQTFVLIFALVFTIIDINNSLGFSFSSMISAIVESDKSNVFVFSDWNNSKFFVRQFFSGILIALAMTGLDQDMMQKNMACKNIKEAKKNILVYGASFIPVNILFLSLGALLLIFASKQGIVLPSKSDEIYPFLATGGYFSQFTAVLFFIGLIAAAFNAADSALTSLTTSFYVDILGFDKSEKHNSPRNRALIHAGFAMLLMATILMFKVINNETIISAIFTAAGYTYGPILGIFIVGMGTKWILKDKYVPVVMVLSPFLTYLLKLLLENFGITVSYELLLYNALITVFGLFILRIAKPIENNNQIL